MPSSKATTWFILVAALFAGLGLMLGQRIYAPRPGVPTAMAATLMYPEPRPVAAFSLERSNGARFTKADLAGRWTVMFFGFTRCPDVCPTTLALWPQVEKVLAASAPGASVQLVFVSVDPEHDTPSRAGAYAAYFSPRIVAATGDGAALDALTRDLGVVYMKSPQGEDYTIDHTAHLVLLGPDATIRGIMRPPLDPNRIAADLAQLAGGAR
ncbi:MAG TPA: SCO family protein [Candidatus Saccharimonadia bacterium]|nr:SCO family protein [Candidatus Saccharimonadia bacterium]